MSAQYARALLNGQIIPFQDAQISLAHPVFTTSNGIYETIKVDNGRPFHLLGHLERLTASAQLIQLELPALNQLHSWANLLIEALPKQSYTIQILVIGETPAEKPSLIIMFPRNTLAYPAELFITGAKAITFKGQRVLPQCKSFNTLINHLARKEAYKAGAIEAILSHNNHLVEGARSNLFVVEANSGELLTPPTSQVLSGISRDIVIQLMKDSPTPVKEGNIALETAVKEMFITSTSMNVLPISTLNNTMVGDGNVGPITKQVMEKFETYYQGIINESQ